VDMEQIIFENWIRPSWAPPAWLFGPVWTVLYLIIFISFGWTFWQVWKGRMPKVILAPFVVNLIANALYTPLQFGLQSFVLAVADILVVWVSIIAIMVVMWNRARWVSYAQSPYLLWVSFATVLQVTIAWLNW
jgi:benzodiazapine receptor